VLLTIASACCVKIAVRSSSARMERLRALAGRWRRRTGRRDAADECKEGFDREELVLDVVEVRCVLIVEVEFSDDLLFWTDKDD